jgi:hypothetical protein
MAVPSGSDFNKWSGTKFTNTDWDQNVDKTVEILANGNYDLNVAQVTATSYVGIPSDQFSTITAGENLTAGDILRISGGQAYKADNTTFAGITAVVGVCNTTVSSGQTVKIDYGFYNSFSSLTAGTKYYVGTSGGLTSTKPDYACEVGAAVSSTRINIEIKNVDGAVTTWTPTYSASGSMTFTSVTTHYATYTRNKDNTSVYVEIKATGTLGGTASTQMKFTPPVTPHSDYTAGTLDAMNLVGGGCSGQSSGAIRGLVTNYDGTNINVFQPTNANFGLGSNAGLYLSGTYRI